MNRKKRNQWISLLLAMVMLAGCAVPQTPADTQPATDGSEQTAPSTQPATQQTTVVTQPPAAAAASFEELAALVSGDALQAGDALHLTGDFEITEAIVFTVPLTLWVEADIICTYPICFETSEYGTIEVAVSEDADVSCLDIRFDAPNCDVFWPSAPYGSERQAAEAVNVNSFNGIDLRAAYGLGGRGETKILSFSLPAEENSALDSDLSYCVDANVIYMAVSYLTEDEALENVTARITFSDGTVSDETLDLSPGEQLYTVTDSNGDTRVYQIITERITYNLPVFYIEIENGKEVTSREKYLNATLRVDTSDAAGDFPELETTQILIRGRGHFSWNFDKTPYKIRFESKTSVLGMEKSKNWVLLSNYTDRSLIQNYVAMEMGKVMTNISYHSTQYPVDVFVNGSYRGVYTFGEQIEAKSERVDLETNYEDPDTDYLLEVGGYDDGDTLNVDYFHAGTLKFVSIKHPESEKLTAEQLDYLISYVCEADNAVKTLTNYEDYIDVDSLIDWVIIHELTYNLDCCFRRSCYLIKEKGGKLKMGPIWDFDLAFGSFYRYEKGDWATIGESGGYVGITWMNYLIEDEAFMARFTARWNEIKQELLSTALDCVDEMSALVAPSAAMNFEVWDILGKKLSAQPSSHKQYDTYEKMIQRLKDFLTDRYDWLDDELN